MLGRLARIAVEMLLTFYAARAGQKSGLSAKSGAVTAVLCTLHASTRRSRPGRAGGVVAGQTM